MSIPTNRFTFKIISSYLVLGTLAVFVCVFLYTELKDEFQSKTDLEDKKLIEAGTLINSLYETDTYANLALLSLSEEDLDIYFTKNDSLYRKIDRLKEITASDLQIQQLDSITALLDEKKENVEQLRSIKIETNEDTSLDAILQQFKNLESEMGKFSVDTYIKNPSKMSKREIAIFKGFIEYSNQKLKDTGMVRASMIDSVLTTSKYIVTSAKRTAVRLKESLLEKESQLIQNELTISNRLRRIIADFDDEITANALTSEQFAFAKQKRTTMVLRYAGIVGSLIILLFSYLLITDFFKSERLKDRLRKEKQFSDTLLTRREQLLSTVSHDLKTPLNTIVGYTELFHNTAPNDKQEYYLDQISTSADYVTGLVNDLLDFSKLDAGKLPLEHIPFSLEDLIMQTVTAAKETHKKEGVSMTLHMDPSLEEQAFKSDPLRIRQIVSNLVGNAIKFTQEGSVIVEVISLKTQHQKQHIQITVKDTGIGISEEKQQLIFNEFTQAENDTSRQFGGSGLGLTISKKLAELLHGSLQVESTLGEGSTFTVLLPLEISEVSVSKKRSKNLRSNGELRALIIDDDPALLGLLKEMLASLGVESKGVSNFSTIESSTKEHYDFVLTDIQMPTVSGFEVLNKLQSQNAANYNKQPVIAMSGSREIQEFTYREKGFVALLQKPFLKNELAQVLHDIFPSKIAEEKTKPVKAAPQKSEYPLFNLSMLKSFFSNETALKEILEIFYTQTDHDFNELVQGIRDKNLDILHAMGHKMLTMARQLEAKRVIPLLEQFENFPANGWETATAENLSQDLKKELDVLINGLKKSTSL